MLLIAKNCRLRSTDYNVHVELLTMQTHTAIDGKQTLLEEPKEVWKDQGVYLTSVANGVRWYLRHQAAQMLKAEEIYDLEEFVSYIRALEKKIIDKIPV